MNKINYFVFDLDGTILFNNKIEDDNVQAILNWQKQGNTFLVATGRGADVFDLLARYKLHPTYVVCSSGAAIATSSKDIEYISVIDKSLAKELFNYLDTYFSQLDYHLDTTQGSKRYGVISNGNMQRHIPDFKAEITNRDEFFNDDCTLLRLFAVGESNEYCYEVKKGIEEKFKGTLAAIKTDNNCLDILPSNCGKWSALQRLFKQYNINVKQVAYIGDQDTDIESIVNCGIGFCMSSAFDNVKQIADYIVDNGYEAIEIVNKLKNTDD